MIAKTTELLIDTYDYMKHNALQSVVVYALYSLVIEACQIVISLYHLGLLTYMILFTRNEEWLDSLFLLLMPFNQKVGTKKKNYSYNIVYSSKKTICRLQYPTHVLCKIGRNIFLRCDKRFFQEIQCTYL